MIIKYAKFHVSEISYNRLFPFIRDVYSDEHRFQQDKDPKHTSSQATTFMDNNGLHGLDLNPIELLSHEPKPFLGKVVKPKNKNELLEGITRF